MAEVSLNDARRETEQWVKEVQAMCRAHGLKYKASMQSAIRHMNWTKDGKPVLEIDMWHGTGYYGAAPAILDVWLAHDLDRRIQVLDVLDVRCFDYRNEPMVTPTKLAEYKLRLRAAKVALQIFLDEEC